MKQWICLWLCLAALVLGTGCKKDTPPPQSTSAPATSAVETVETTETADGILVTTPYYTVMLPSFWEGNYEIGFSEEDGGYSLRFMESVSKASGSGGHLFTLTVSAQMDAVSESVTGHAFYAGLLKADKAYAVTYWKSTDVQFDNDRMEIFNQMVDSRFAIIASLAAAGQGTVYYPTGAKSFEQRAALTHLSETGEEVAADFSVATGRSVTYVGVCLDSIWLEDEYGGYELYSYDFFVYKDVDGVFYLIPFNSTEGTVACVYQMTDYPTVETLWEPAE